MDVRDKFGRAQGKCFNSASATVDKWAGPEPTMSSRRKWKNLELIYNMT